MKRLSFWLNAPIEYNGVAGRLTAKGRAMQ